MGDDFIIGITDLVSGEKDPRNLMIVFSMLRVVMIEFDISGHVEVRFTTSKKSLLIFAFRSSLILFFAIFQSHFGHPLTTLMELRHRISKTVCGAALLRLEIWPSTVSLP